MIRNHEMFLKQLKRDISRRFDIPFDVRFIRSPEHMEIIIEFRWEFRGERRYRYGKMVMPEQRYTQEAMQMSMIDLEGVYYRGVFNKISDFIVKEKSAQFERDFDSRERGGVCNHSFIPPRGRLMFDMDVISKRLDGFDKREASLTGTKKKMSPEEKMKKENDELIDFLLIID